MSVTFDLDEPRIGDEVGDAVAPCARRHQVVLAAQHERGDPDARVRVFGAVHEHRSELRPEPRSGSYVLAGAPHDHGGALDSDVRQQSPDLATRRACRGIDRRRDEHDATDE